jgi:hypothetical protein
MLSWPAWHDGRLVGVRAGAARGRRVVAIDLVDPRLRDSAAAERALRLLGDRITKAGTGSLAELEPGEGDVVGHDGEKGGGLAPFRRRLVAVPARCTISAAR